MSLNDKELAKIPEEQELVSFSKESGISLVAKYLASKANKPSTKGEISSGKTKDLKDPSIFANDQKLNNEDKTVLQNTFANQSQHQELESEQTVTISQYDANIEQPIGFEQEVGNGDSFQQADSKDRAVERQPESFGYRANIEQREGNVEPERLEHRANIEQQEGNIEPENLGPRVDQQKGLVKQTVEINQQNRNLKSLIDKHVQHSKSTIIATSIPIPDNVQPVVTSLDGAVPGWPSAPTHIDVTALFAVDDQLKNVSCIITCLAISLL